METLESLFSNVTDELIKSLDTGYEDPLFLEIHKRRMKELFDVDEGRVNKSKVRCGMVRGQMDFEGD